MGKGGGGGGQTQSTVTNTNIPEYARGYVENMLGATQNQLFNTSTNPTTGETELGTLRPYQAYGGTYDPSGNMTSYDPSKAVAGFTPMQQMAQNGIYNLQMPGQFDAASAYTADAMQRAANAGYNPGQFTMGQAYAPDVNYYQMNQPSNVYGENAQATNLGRAPVISAAERMRAARLDSAPLGEFQTGTAAELNTSPTVQAAQLGIVPTASAHTGSAAQLRDAAMMEAAQAEFTRLGEVPLYTGQQLDYTPQNIGFERVNALPLERLQMQAAGNVGTGSFIEPGAANAYMSPYMQNVVDIEKREAQRQADIASTRRGAGFAQAGAFGGSRQAIENAEAARNLATQQGDIQSKGLQSAFQAAQGQFNTEQQAALQAALANQAVQQQTGVQNLSALLQTQGLGAQTGLTAQQLNQAAGIDTSKFNQSQQYNTALQNAQLLQQQQLANQSLQGQYGLTQGQMDQAIRLANAGFQQTANVNNQSALNQFSLQQGTMDQQMAMANLANQQQAEMANQALAGQFGLQQGSMEQQAALANQALEGQYGLQQGTMNQQMAMGNVANRQQTAMANQALQGQYGLQQGQFNQAAAAANQQAANQIALANQGILGQYGLNQGQLSQANRQFNAQQNQAANLANQQMAYNTGLQNLQANLGVQQLGAGQNMQAQLANQQAMLANQQAIEQSRQFGANYGQQMNAQQLAAAQQLGGLGQQQLAAQQGIYGLQNQIGGQQQQLQQQIINQAMQDYANAQQYPLMQLGTMSNMLRGLPMQASTTNMYQAAPNAITQGIGAVGAYGALNGAFGGTTGKKEGGVINAAKGGIMSYDVGGEIESTLSKMDVDDLKKYAKESNSPTIKQMAARLIQEKSMPVPRMARGGILAFAKSTDENNQSLVEGEDAEKLRRYGGAPSWLYNPGEALSNINPFRMMAERHAESFGTKPTTSVAPPPELLEKPTTGAAGFPMTPAPAIPQPSRAAPPQGIAQAAPAPIVAPPVVPVARPPAPAGIKGAPAYPTQTKLPDTPEETAYRAQAAAINAETNKPLASYVEDIKAGYKAAGIDPENTGMKDYRSRIMAERANIDDEAARQKNMRLAEFFASWGSTPGATLVAGMSALKKTIPTLIEDEKERKKALRESDKIIYELDQAERLEKKGLVAEASAKKEKIADRAEKFNAGLATIAGSRRTAEVADTGHKASYQATIFNTETHAALEKAKLASAAADRAAARDTSDYSKAFGAYQIANDSLARTKAAIDNAKRTGPYADAQNEVKRLSALKDPSEQVTRMLNAAKSIINNADTEYSGRVRDAEKMVEIAEARVKANDKGAAVLANATGVPAGYKSAGYTPDGKPVYQDAKGNKFVGQ